MRLIDADRLKLVFEKNVVSADIFNSLIDEQPTVDAIPVQWIEEWLLSCDVTYKRLAIESLLKDWQAEQEKQNDNN